MRQLVVSINLLKLFMKL